ncbi:MAG: zinc ribbon domain-containing protein [Desulfomonilaceae bacterium]
MKEQLQLLMRLQDIDVQVDQHETILEQLPNELQEMARNLVSLRHEISETEESSLAAETELQKKESELSVEQEKIKRSERRLLSIKNLKEHEALSREIRLGKKVAGEIEEEVLELMNRLEQFKKSLDRKTADYGDCEKKMVERKAESEKILFDAAKALESLKVEQQDLAENVTKEYFKRYTMVRKLRGNAIAEMVNGSCDGCHIAITPQLGLRVLRQQEFIYCPNCHRILYVKPENIPLPNGAQ